MDWTEREWRERRELIQAMSKAAEESGEEDLEAQTDEDEFFKVEKYVRARIKQEVDYVHGEFQVNVNVRKNFNLNLLIDRVDKWVDSRYEITHSLQGGLLVLNFKIKPHDRCSVQ